MSGFHFIGIHINEISQTVLFFLAIITFLCIIRVGYSHTKKIQSILPESSLIIIIGIIMGTLIAVVDHDSLKIYEDLFTFKPELLLYIFVPIVVFEAGYDLDTVTFFRNIGSILAYAVVGTLANTLLLFFGFRLFTFSFDLPSNHLLAFCALVSAVDPVSVLAVYSRLGVNKQLVELSVGESLLNDAVAIVLFSLFSGMDEGQMEESGVLHIALAGTLKFLISFLGGIIMGTVVTCLFCLLLKKSDTLRVMESVIPLVAAYGSFQLSDSLLLSGVTAIMISGILLKRFGEPNMTDHSAIAVHQTTGALASVSETILFLVLGVEAAFIIEDEDIRSEVDWLFVVLTPALCLVVRFICVFGITALINSVGSRRANGEAIPLRQQFLLSWAGVRGAISFALAVSLSTDWAGRSSMLMGGVCVIFVSIFLCGSLVPLWIKVLKIQLLPKLHPLSANIVDGDGECNLARHSITRPLTEFMDAFNMIAGSGKLGHETRHVWAVVDGWLQKVLLRKLRPTEERTLALLQHIRRAEVSSSLKHEERDQAGQLRRRLARLLDRTDRVDRGLVEMQAGIVRRRALSATARYDPHHREDSHFDVSFADIFQEAEKLPKVAMGTIAEEVEINPEDPTII